MHADAFSPVLLIRVRLLLYRAKGVVQKMPDIHYVDHRIELTPHDHNCITAKVYEIAEAHYSPLKKKAK